MNKAELIAQVADETKLSKADVERAHTAIFDAITNAVGNGDEVRVTGFGKFSRKITPAHTGRNPATGAPVEVPEARRLVFKASSKL